MWIDVEMIDPEVLNVEARRMSPWTSYPLASSSSARYEPSCPVIPVMSARFIRSLLLSVHARHPNVWHPIIEVVPATSRGHGTSPSLNARFS